MTPKEKAIELIEQFSLFQPDEMDELITKKGIEYRARKCALICVDEINNALQNISALQVIGNVLLDQIKYYQEVKQEITNYDRSKRILPM